MACRLRKALLTGVDARQLEKIITILVANGYYSCMYNSMQCESMCFGDSCAVAAMLFKRYFVILITYFLLVVRMVLVVCIMLVVRLLLLACVFFILMSCVRF